MEDRGWGQGEEMNNETNTGKKVVIDTVYTKKSRGKDKEHHY